MYIIIYSRLQISLHIFYQMRMQRFMLSEFKATIDVYWEIDSVESTELLFESMQWLNVVTVIT